MNNLINMFDLVFCLTNIGDLISNEITSHHKKVAYLAYRIAENFGLTVDQQKEIFLAGLLHDIGAFSTKSRLELNEIETPNANEHAFIGAKIIENFQPLSNVSKIIKYHHIPWDGGKGRKYIDDNVPLASHILHLADRIAVCIDVNKEVLGQIEGIVKKIKAQSKSKFMPELVDAFVSISNREYIWLDLTYESLMENMPRMINFYNEEITFDQVVLLSEIFANIIDFRSSFTATHSSGVAAVAEKLAILCGFSERESQMMKIAGYLHDLGKLVVDNEILEKPTELSTEEFNSIKCHSFYTYRTLQVIRGFETINIWASYHHEKMNGEGYPFHVTAENIPLGSRIMAHADIFIALTEDRPYRKGMRKEKTLEIIKSLVDDNSICPYVYSILEENFEFLSAIRENAQKQSYMKYLYVKDVNETSN